MALYTPPTTTAINNTKPMNRAQFLQNIPLFEGLTAAQTHAISADLVKRQFAQGDIIFREGDPGEVLYIVHTGRVRIFVSGSHSETSVILFGKAGDIFGELAIVDGLPRSASAAAVEEAVVYTLERHTFRNHMRHYPQLALNFMKLLSVRVRYNTHKVNSLASMSVPSRLARQLLTLAQDYGRVHPDGVLIHSHLTQTELASLIGATRESTNKALATFRRQELIGWHEGQIVILDPEALRAKVQE
jgi:CRP/FNR family transcriptional regulator, cyclic AMP receptor protein